MKPATRGPSGGPTKGEAVNIIIGAWSSFRTNIYERSVLTVPAEPPYSKWLRMAYIADSAAYQVVSNAKHLFWCNGTSSIHLTCNAQESTSSHAI